MMKTRSFLFLRFQMLVLGGLFLLTLNCFSQEHQQSQQPPVLHTYPDVPFIQETQDSFKISNHRQDNQVRSIAVDHDSNVWIATASGVFRKESHSRDWEPIISGEDRGPAYSVVVNPNGDVLLGTWNGLYRYRHNRLSKENGVNPPISVICNDGDGDYALGPNGVWRFDNGKWIKQNYNLARSVRDAMTDDKGLLWVATDVGLYKCKNGKATLFQNTSELISCYARALAFDSSGNIWTGVMGGVSVRDDNHLLRNIAPKQGLPNIYVSCITQGPNGVMWVGTEVGVTRFAPDGSHSLLFSRRWLRSDKVTSIAFDAQGNAWIGTDNGVSEIKRTKMTLLEKEKVFYSKLMKRHIRPPWICGIIDLVVPGDTSKWLPSDDDNDGEYTSGYLAMESFRYAVTKSEDARSKAHKAFEFLKRLQTITGTEGFFARSMVPVSWKSRVHDPNRSYTRQQIADELVKDPRFKPVETRWHKSKDGKWLWKGDTSSDEMDGHLMGYFYYYELAATDRDKVEIRHHVKVIMDYVMKHHFNLVDVDGTHTRWGVWSPDQLNGEPDWASERSLNSMELLAYLKFTYHLTGDNKYEKAYRRLIDQEGYLDNMSRLNAENPAWQVYFDRTLEGYLFPILLKYETNPKLKAFYRKVMDVWMMKQTSGENLINNLAYTFATGERVNVKQTLFFLRNAPLDLVDWHIDQTKREDIKIVRSPILDDLEVNQLPPPEIRATVRWDKNPWAAIQGNPRIEREPVFWLWPYWEARYLGIIGK